MATWNLKPTGSSLCVSAPRGQSSTSSIAAPETISSNKDKAIGQSYIASGMIFEGEITGSGSLVIDGRIEGGINLPEGHITVGIDGEVAADVIARDVVVLGKVLGNITALNRLSVHAVGSVTGRGIAVRLAIEEGALVNGRMDTALCAAELEAEVIAGKEPTRHSKTFLSRKAGSRGIDLPASFNASLAQMGHASGCGRCRDGLCQVRGVEGRMPFSEVTSVGLLLLAC